MTANMAMVEGIESIVDRTLDYIADTIKLILLTNTYVANKDHQFIDEGGVADMVDARVPGTTDQTLTGKATGKDLTGDFAAFTASNATFTAVAGGATAGQVGLYKDTGVATTSKILGVFDITDITTNGGDITIQFASLASGGLVKWAAA
jgi:hypothetical protein